LLAGFVEQVQKDINVWLVYMCVCASLAVIISILKHDNHNFENVQLFSQYFFDQKPNFLLTSHRSLIFLVSLFYFSELEVTLSVWTSVFRDVTNNNSVALVCEHTIPTERPPFFGEVDANTSHFQS
jgi:hypothetical protein